MIFISLSWDDEEIFLGIIIARNEKLFEDSYDLKFTLWSNFIIS